MAGDDTIKPENRPAVRRTDVKELKERILQEGIAVDEEVLKVDSFLNHKVDPQLMHRIGQDFAAHFQDQGITKIVTIESSGIAPALMTAYEMQIPMVILKKHPSRILNDDLYQTEVMSYTTKIGYELSLSSHQIDENDHVLIIDDFLANGEAVTGAMRLMHMAGATVAGLGIVIEKSYQPGRDKIVSQGVPVYSLARIRHMEKGHIDFYPEED